MGKGFWAVLCLSLLAGAGLSAEGAAVGISKIAPVQDGRIGEGEYSYSASFGDFSLAASLSADGATLYLAVEAPVSGWVALGLGSTRMDGAYLVLGSAAGGKGQVSEQLGRGHSHSQAGPTRLLKSAVRASGGKTCLEIALPASAYVSGGKLNLVFSASPSASLSMIHSMRSFAELTVLAPKP